MDEPQLGARGMASYLVPAAVWIPAVVALIGLVVAPFLTYRYGLKSQLKLTTKQKQLEAYSKLMGQKILVAQLFVSRLEAYTFSDYHERRWQLAGKPTDSLDFQEGQRWMHKSEDLGIEFTKSRKDLYEILGLVRSYFSNSSKLKDFTHSIFHYNFFYIEKRPFELNAEQLETWKVGVIREVENKTENEFTKLVDELLTYLEAEIDIEAN